ncbi:hypothetical protein MNEG_10265 [Monoraphidium neglectum]|uniref:Uncharacterized protein n=1 Tax=Monoraphidium neglectum TaxID=145388 RepID=A0A0D2JDT5_9CHLO|nr:hypothetical protein MNEG_10265 [Monoraphidium neglectum]KIY97697.1 hypothetical protein MNEG_10265 [Monoraphidium neglectum]|eukprot:XP_013896717.1 hypothetical protein MNEG_10265 [Monoraphidium neglectum]
MARECRVILAVALLLAPGALGASLKAGGLTDPGSRALGIQAVDTGSPGILGGSWFSPASRGPPTSLSSTGFGSSRSGLGNLLPGFGGFDNALNTRGSRGQVSNLLGSRPFGGRTPGFPPSLASSGGSGSGFGSSGGAVPAYTNTGGAGTIFRRLGEQAAAAAAASARIEAVGGRTPGSAAPDAVTNSMGALATGPYRDLIINYGSMAALGARAAPSFHKSGRPAADQGGRGQIFRRLGEQAAASAAANTIAMGGRTAGFAPSDRAPITNPAGSSWGSFNSKGVHATPQYRGMLGNYDSVAAPGTSGAPSFDKSGSPAANQGGHGSIF